MTRSCCFANSRMFRSRTTLHSVVHHGFGRPLWHRCKPVCLLWLISCRHLSRNSRIREIDAIRRTACTPIIFKRLGMAFALLYSEPPSANALPEPAAPLTGPSPFAVNRKKCESMSKRLVDDDSAVYLVGSGIASLAAAAFLIRDGNIPGPTSRFLRNPRKSAEVLTPPDLRRTAMSCVAAECSRANTSVPTIYFLQSLLSMGARR